MKCRKEFLSPDRKRIRRCNKCKRDELHEYDAKRIRHPPGIDFPNISM